MLRKIKLVQRDPERTLAEGVIWSKGRVSMWDWRLELVVPWYSVDALRVGNPGYSIEVEPSEDA